MLELIINKELDKKTIMLVENGILVEKHEEHENHQRLEGNIYCGKVQSVLQGMQSAFIDIGDKRNTFIRLKDLLPKEDETKTDINNKIKENSNRKQHISHKSTFFAIIQKTDIKLTSFYSLIKMDYLSLDF